ncbi:Transcriptional regulator GlxA family, contains an amidase domain and an AraC-type DNA-binding HTH domain [Nocardioides scoriae]|uniref:Transcriptional regulator GlxA family, contains an amidase domain and an AraC-type DNA-binding HTH domain n=1 Tax=Nocardioides scoriae TaxID=642780 RepID=A0A1H1QFL9_9ACTN|nr:helix-turn-helix domain-containing protein [Nocardioides scoriae]SDS22206.1 Transcriptional regulator GlxA family, contains an amidase domain and an AraC-type DNA-binding HTH domain [Nocardioides scoriae]
MLTNVAVVVDEGVAPFELGLLCEAFGVDRSDDGVPLLDFAVCGPGRATVRTSGGFTVTPDHDLARLAEADLVGVPAFDGHLRASPPVVEALRAAHDRGAQLLSVCSGAFVLGDAGLLDGRRCTTHWRHTQELAERFPLAVVVPEVLYVDDDRVVTSAGTAAGLDASLHVWRQEHGSAVASAVARRMVVPPQREGGQAQFVARPVVDCDAETLAPLLTWALGHLEEDLGVEALSRQALLSPRTFARRFREETGTTPHAWVTAQRLAEAERLLETSDLSVEQVAQRVGMNGAATLRHQFQRARGISPQTYRRAFRRRDDEAAAS